MLRLRSASKAPVLIYVAALLCVNAYICRDLFFAEYTGHTNSIQGLWISMAGLAGEHWFRPSWWPFHDGGMPFEHAYMPLVPGATAAIAKVAGVSPARALNALIGLLYCLGPVTLFLMAWRMTGAPGYSFWAALLYSLTSPARALIADPRFDPSLLWTSRRLYTMVVWDDAPHAAALCLVPLAILFLWLSIERRRPVYYVAAGVSVAASVLASVFGAVAIVISAICLLLALPRERLAPNARVVAAIGALAYLAVCPFLPPSLIATIRANQQMFPEDRWSLGSLTALSVVILGWVLLSRLLQRWTRDWTLRFFVMFAFLASAIPLLEAYAKRHFLPQAGRYQPEMEIGIALAVVFALRPAARKLPLSVKYALGFFLLCVAGEQMVRHRRYAKEITWSRDMTGSIEYRVARWVDEHMPGERVMVPGSIAQWFNVFSRTPQLSGGSYSTTPNWAQQDAMTSVLTGAGAKDAAVSLLWLKAFGVRAVVVVGSKSTEFWKPYADPKKFEGLPVLWQEDDVAIYSVSGRAGDQPASLAHVIAAGAEARRRSAGELGKYVAALEDAGAPVAEMRWDGFRRVVIRTVARREQVVSVQVNYRRGWHARANGRTVAIRADGIGLMLVDPRCEGSCEIELRYDGGWEYLVCRGVSLLTVLGVVAYVLRGRKRARAEPNFI